MFPHFYLLLILLYATCSSAAGFSGSSMTGMKRAADIQRRQLDRLRDFLGPVYAGTRDTASDSSAKRDATTGITFSNLKAQEYYVDGTKIPEGELPRLYFRFDLRFLPRSTLLVDFDAGPSWAGLMPISSAANETRKLFFWYAFESCARQVHCR